MPTAEFGDVQDANDEIRKIAGALRPLAATFLDNRTFQMFDALQYIEQGNMFQGRNLIIKLHISDRGESYIHVKTFVFPPADTQKPVITGIMRNQTLGSVIENFN